jgi:multisubunit Na+/H+ antiporter MnhG subunit
MRTVIADIFLGLAVIVVLASSAGILVMRGAYRKLHYVTPAALVAPLLVGIAILIQSGWSGNSAQTWLALLLVVIAGPFLSHATIRAARIRETGDWRIGPGPQDEPGDRQ